MHHKYDVSSKDAFYIIDLAAAAGIFFLILGKEAHFVPFIALWKIPQHFLKKYVTINKLFHFETFVLQKFR